MSVTNLPIGQGVTNVWEFSFPKLQLAYRHSLLTFSPILPFP